MERYKKIFDESILDSVKKELNPIIFRKDNSMLPNVSRSIKDIITKWLDEVAPEAVIIGLDLLGSSAGYRWNNTSDVDINLKLENITSQKIRDILPLRPNGNFLEGTDHPINYFLVTDDKAIEQADNVYDILNDTWVKFPVIDDTIIPYTYIVEIAKMFMVGVDSRIMEYEADIKELNYYNELLKSEENVDKNDIQERISIKEEEVKADLDAIKIGHHIINAFRNEAFDEDFNTTYLIEITSKSPNVSINNLIYKVLEQFGYIEKLQKYEKIRKGLV